MRHLKKQSENTPEKIEKYTCTIATACARYELGRDSMRRIAEDAGAIVRIGRNLHVNVSLVDKYMNSISQ